MIRLSPTTLNLFRDCPRCFWLQMNKNIHRPRGIFPSLPGGMDGVIKKYYDKHRKKGELPEEIREVVKGQLMPDLEVMEQWRNWRTGLEYRDKKREATLFGALDDCVIEEDFYIPLDYKTRGYAPEEGKSEEYYGNQLNCYALLLQENGYKVKDYAYLVYYFPKTVKKNGAVQFEVKPIKLSVDPETGRKTFEAALDCLAGKEPAKHSDCEYCSWNAAQIEEFD